MLCTLDESVHWSRSGYKDSLFLSSIRVCLYHLGPQNQGKAGIWGIWSNRDRLIVGIGGTPRILDLSPKSGSPSWSRWWSTFMENLSSGINSGLASKHNIPQILLLPALCDWLHRDCMVSSLPFDVLPIILSHLSIFDILQLRLVRVGGCFQNSWNADDKVRSAKIIFMLLRTTPSGWTLSKNISYAEISRFQASTGDPSRNSRPMT